MPQTSQKLTPEIITLHRYFIWADRMKVHFDTVLKNLSSRPKDGNFLTKKEGIETFMYMSLWYGMLYVLIEGWFKLDLHDEKIDFLLQSENVKLLKTYRHGVFHFHKEYYDQKFLKLMGDGQDIANWSRDLRDEFSRWFIDIHRNESK